MRINGNMKISSNDSVLGDANILGDEKMGNRYVSIMFSSVSEPLLSVSFSTSDSVSLSISEEDSLEFCSYSIESRNSIYSLLLIMRLSIVKSLIILGFLQMGQSIFFDSMHFSLQWRQM